jgi:hypothetical protein
VPDQVKWKGDAKARFERWLSTELHNTLADRQGLNRQWANYIQQYDAPRVGPGEFPYPGASNEEMPLTGMHFEPVLANIMQSIHAPSNLWTAIALQSDFVENANPTTEYLSVVEKRYIKMREVNQRAFPDLILLGTCAYQNTWWFDRRKMQGYDTTTGTIASKVRLIDQPIVRHIPLPDFIWPANSWDIDPDAMVAPARWCGHRFKLTENELRARSKGQQPWLPNYDKKATDDILKREFQEEEIVEKEIRERDTLRPSLDQKIELYAITARYDTDEDGIDEDVLVIWHQRSGTILRAIHNPFWHGKWEYEVAQYIKTFSLLGKGIANMNEYAQAIGSRLLNAQVDNALLANTRVYGVPEGYEHMGPGTPMYPGKTFPLRPGEDIKAIGTADIYPSTFALLQQLKEWAETRTSVSELRTGNVSGLPSRTPATTVLSLLQEGNKKFDMIMGNLRSGALANIGKRTLQMIAQRHQQGATKWEQLARDTLGETDAEAVIAVLNMEQAAIEEGFGIDVTATSGQVNREVQKQNLVGLAQFYGQAGAQLLQLVQMIGDQNLVMQTALGIYSGGRELMMRLLEAYEIQNPERYVPPPLSQEQQAQAGAGLQPGLQSQFPPQAGGIDPQIAQLLGIG